MDDCPLWVLCVLSGRGFSDGLITRAEEFYRLWCVLVCDLETSKIRRLKLIKGCKCRIEKNKTSWNLANLIHNTLYSVEGWYCQCKWCDRRRSYFLPRNLSWTEKNNENLLSKADLQPVFEPMSFCTRIKGPFRSMPQYSL
jgi:hypothetical protein